MGVKAETKYVLRTARRRCSRHALSGGKRTFQWIKKMHGLQWHSPLRPSRRWGNRDGKRHSSLTNLGDAALAADLLYLQPSVEAAPTTAENVKEQRW